MGAEVIAQRQQESKTGVIEYDNDTRETWMREHTRPGVAG